MDNEKEISFGAFDSELMHQEIFIPEGFTATIDGNKIILTRIENEDERIRKELIGYIVKEVGLYPGEDRKEHKWLRWLEKQGEHKKFRDSIQVGDEVTRNSDGVIVNMSQLKRVAKPAQQKLPIEKLPEEMKTIGESLGFTTQKECDEYNKMVSDLIMSDNDKVELKFKVGDWVAQETLHSPLRVVDVSDIEYRVEDVEGSSGVPKTDFLDRNYHLWTIQDAKVGDVLAAHECYVIFKEIDGLNIKCYCTYHYMNNPSFHVDTLHNKDAFHPATKEQRDLLFAKMKEAGYTFDFEKKELKKVEKKSQRMISAEAKEAMYDKPTDEDMKEALRTEYEKGRADAIAEMRKKLSDSKSKRQEVIRFLESLRLKED